MLKTYQLSNFYITELVLSVCTASFSEDMERRYPSVGVQCKGTDRSVTNADHADAAKCQFL